MPTIQFSPGSAGTIGKTLFVPHNQTNGLNTQSGGTGYLSGYGGGTNSFIRIMQGSPPTAWSELSNSNTSRSGDTLIEFANTNSPTLGSNSIEYYSSIVSGNTYVNINTGLVAATQSGTANWFWMLTCNTGTGNILQQFVGTNITTVGGGGDLEIQSKSIVSGTQYSLSNLRIEFPSTFTY